MSIFGGESGQGTPIVYTHTDYTETDPQWKLHKTKGHTPSPNCHYCVQDSD